MNYKFKFFIKEIMLPLLFLLLITTVIIYKTGY